MGSVSLMEVMALSRKCFCKFSKCFSVFIYSIYAKFDFVIFTWKIFSHFREAFVENDANNILYSFRSRLRFSSLLVDIFDFSKTKPIWILNVSLPFAPFLNCLCSSFICKGNEILKFRKSYISGIYKLEFEN